MEVFKLLDGVELRFVPYCTVLYVRRADLLARYHHMAGHSGVDTMLHSLEPRFWWPDLRKDVKNWLAL